MRFVRARLVGVSVSLSVRSATLSVEAFRGFNLRDFRNVHMGKKRVILAKNVLFEHFVGDFDQFGTVFVVIFT